MNELKIWVKRSKYCIVDTFRGVVANICGKLVHVMYKVKMFIAIMISNAGWKMGCRQSRVYNWSVNFLYPF